MTEEQRFKILIKYGWTYNHLTGVVCRNKEQKVRSDGYIDCTITINNKCIRAFSHRLAWYIYYNEVPDTIDHINGIKHDNRIVNLRNITQQKNTFNSKNTKGYNYTKSGKFYARIIINRKFIGLGTYDTEKEAHQAYLDAKKIYHII